MACTVTLGICPTAHEEPPPSESFAGETLRVSKQYEQVWRDANALGAEGDVAAANQKLLALYSKDARPVVAFIVANALFRVAPEDCQALHETAFAALPDEPVVALELALDLHRKGDCARAAPLYQRALGGAARIPPQYRALLAECLVQDGRLAEAVAAWNAADHRSNHIAIETAICEAHCPLKPGALRADLIERVARGEPEAAERLIDLDLNAHVDWWNDERKPSWIKHDMPIIAKALGETSPRLAQLKTWIAVTEPERDAASIKARLENDKLILGDGGLPVSSLVASRIVGAAAEKQVMTPAEFASAKRFIPELSARAYGKAGDVEALNFLWHFLEAKSGPRASATDGNATPMCASPRATS
jgi:hypothetical protein